MAAKSNKTQANEQCVEAFLAAVEPAARRADAHALCALMGRLSVEPPHMWGPSIVGFGRRHYRYDSGREGGTLKVGFSPRKAALVLYGLGAAKNEQMVAALGSVTTGKGCIYVMSLADIDMGRLESLISHALAA